MNIIISQNKYGSSYKEKCDIDFLYYDERFNFIYGNEQYICFSAIKGLGLGVGLRIFMLCL